jgi:hypothetical protein
MILAKQVAENRDQRQKVPQALKRVNILNALMARVELVPFPRPFASDVSRKLLRQAPRAPQIARYESAGKLHKTLLLQ